MIRLSLIAAVSNNDVIGIGNELPWRLPGDLKFFRRVTMGKPIIMGRKTYDSIGKALPGRTNIVVTSQRNWQATGVEVCHSLEEALMVATTSASSSGAKEMLVIGGEQIYREAMPLATRLYITRVDVSLHGDAFFPAIDAECWRETLIGHSEPEGDVPGYGFLVLDKRG